MAEKRQDALSNAEYVSSTTITAKDHILSTILEYFVPPRRKDRQKTSATVELVNYQNRRSV